MRPLVAHCRPGRARLFQRTGMREPAQEQFAASATCIEKWKCNIGWKTPKARLLEFSPATAALDPTRGEEPRIVCTCLTPPVACTACLDVGARFLLRWQD